MSINIIQVLFYVWTHLFCLLHFIQEQRTHLFREKTVESYLFSHMIYMLRHGMYDINKQELNDRDNPPIGIFPMKLLKVKIKIFSSKGGTTK